MLQKNSENHGKNATSAILTRWKSLVRIQRRPILNLIDNAAGTLPVPWRIARGVLVRAPWSWVSAAVMLRLPWSCSHPAGATS